MRKPSQIPTRSPGSRSPRSSLRLCRSLPLLAAAVAGLVALAPRPARADRWIVSPQHDTSQNAVTLELQKAGLGDALNTALQALAGSAALASSYRLIDLESGDVIALSELELAGITWVDGGQIVTAASVADQGSKLVMIETDFEGMGTAVVVLEGTMPATYSVLSADQRQLVGEMPCDIGFAPESGSDGISCVDIDECTASLDDCAEHAACTNTDGSFKCKCDKGYSGDGKMCMAPDMMMDPDAGLMTDDASTPDTDAMVEPDTDAGMTVQERMKKHGGCGCSVPGAERETSGSGLAWLASLALLGVVLVRRRARR